ncbi:hypothetical protein WA158_000450 [Blastocystis sp. Blastoise]
MNDVKIWNLIKQRNIQKETISDILSKLSNLKQYYQKPLTKVFNTSFEICAFGICEKEIKSMNSLKSSSVTLFTFHDYILNEGIEECLQSYEQFNIDFIMNRVVLLCQTTSTMSDNIIRWKEYSNLHPTVTIQTLQNIKEELIQQEFYSLFDSLPNLHGSLLFPSAYGDYSLDILLLPCCLYEKPFLPFTNMSTIHEGLKTLSIQGVIHNDDIDQKLIIPICSIYAYIDYSMDYEQSQKNSLRFNQCLNYLYERQYSLFMYTKNMKTKLKEYYLLVSTEGLSKSGILFKLPCSDQILPIKKDLVNTFTMETENIDPQFDLILNSLSPKPFQPLNWDSGFLDFFLKSLKKKR